MSLKKIHIQNKIATIMLLFLHCSSYTSELTTQGRNLFNATKMGNDNMIQYLLSKNIVDVNITNKLGNTALMHAAVFGKEREAQLLICHGANINAADKSHRTALMYAAHNEQYKMILLLLKNGASLPTKKEMKRARLPKKTQLNLSFLDHEELPEVINKLILDFTYNRTQKRK